MQSYLSADYTTNLIPSIMHGVDYIFQEKNYSKTLSHNKQIMQQMTSNFTKDDIDFVKTHVMNSINDGTISDILDHLPNGYDTDRLVGLDFVILPDTTCVDAKDMPKLTDAEQALCIHGSVTFDKCSIESNPSFVALLANTTITQIGNNKLEKPIEKDYRNDMEFISANEHTTYDDNRCLYQITSCAADDIVNDAQYFVIHGTTLDPMKYYNISENPTIDISRKLSLIIDLACTYTWRDDTDGLLTPRTDEVELINKIASCVNDKKVVAQAIQPALGAACINIEQGNINNDEINTLLTLSEPLKDHTNLVLSFGDALDNENGKLSQENKQIIHCLMNNSFHAQDLSKDIARAKEDLANETPDNSDAIKAKDTVR